MQTLKDLTLESFLPLSQMDQVATSAHSTYLAAKSFPHVVFDNFFDPSIVDLVLQEFPKPDAIRWQKFDNAAEIKLASSKEASSGLRPGFPASRLPGFSCTI